MLSITIPHQLMSARSLHNMSVGSLSQTGRGIGSSKADGLSLSTSAGGHDQFFTQVGYYKGAMVAVQTVKKTSLTLNRDDLLELKMVGPTVKSEYSKEYSGQNPFYPYDWPYFDEQT